MDISERDRRSESRRNRLRQRMVNAGIVATETILFFSAPHVHPVPTALSIERQVSRARAIISKCGADSPYKGINIQ